MSTRLPRPFLRDLHARFVILLPRIESHARVVFRGVKCPAKQDDRIAETVALAWDWFRRLARRGKDASRFPTALASYAAKAVKSGRRVAGMEKAKDAMNEATQTRRGFYVGKLPDCSTLSDNPLSDALIDNRVSPVPDQAAFRIDLPAFRGSYDGRRRIMDALALGERTKDVAGKFNMSQARVSQLRRQFHDSWDQFTRS